MSPTLRCDQVTKRYGDAFTLGPLSINVEVGVTCLVGPNGAGKSTLFRLIAGVDRPTTGDLRLVADGHVRACGYLPQSPLLPQGASCEEFLNYVAWLQRIPATKRASAVERALHIADLADRRTDRIRKLSGGMARRLGIAHALIHDPPLLLLDEPTSGLDPRQRVTLRRTIAQLGRDRIVLVATHLVEDVRGVADRVIVLNSGRIVFDGDVAELASRSHPGAPGDTDLERAISALMEGSE